MTRSDPSLLARDATADPIHRALFAGRRLILVPWARGIEPDSDPWDRGPRPGAERPVVFDIWEIGGDADLLARQHGAGEASTEVEALRRWAERSGARLRIGAPLGPAAPAVRGPAQCEIQRAENATSPPAVLMFQ